MKILNIKDLTDAELLHALELASNAKYEAPVEWQRMLFAESKRRGLQKGVCLD